jgi:hypothetical protein
VTTISLEEFDRLFAESAGPYLRTYLAARLGRPDVDDVLADVFIGLVHSRAAAVAATETG